MRVISKQKFGFRLKNGSLFVLPLKERVDIPDEIAEDDYFKLAVKSDLISILSQPVKQTKEKTVKKKKKEE